MRLVVPQRNESVEALDGSRIPARIGRYFGDAEEIVTGQRAHWAMLLLPVVLLFGGLALVANAAPDATRTGGELLWKAWLILFAWVALRVWLWSQHWVVVTNRRIVHVERTPWSARLSQLMLIMGRDITVDRTLLGDLLGFGTFIFESARDGHPMRQIRYVANPDDLLRVISEAVNGGTAGVGGPGGGPSSAGPAGTRPGAREQTAGGRGGVLAGVVIGGENEGGIIAIEAPTSNPTEPIPATTPSRPQAPLSPDNGRGWAPPWSTIGSRWSGQSHRPGNPGIISSNAPRHSSPGAIEDRSVPTRRPFSLLRLVQRLSLFRRRR